MAVDTWQCRDTSSMWLCHKEGSLEKNLLNGNSPSPNENGLFLFVYMGA
jgi:hypothetical protein